LKTATQKPKKLSILKASIARKWAKDTPTASIFRNMAMLATGSAAAKAISALSIPIITRIYLPEHMGVLSVFTALTAMLVPLGTMRYSMAIPLPRHDGAAFNLALLCASCLLVVSIFFTFLFWIFSPPLLALLSMEELLPYWWLLPLAIAGAGLYELLSNWAVRDKAFKPLAKTRVWQTAIGSSAKIGLGLLGLKPLGLLIGQVFTQAGGILSLFLNFFQKFRSTWRHVSKRRMVFFLKRYADFPKYRLPSQFLLIFSTKAPLFYFAWQFGAESTGQLGLALMVLALPMTLFGQSTGRAYYAEIARIGQKRPGEIYDVTTSITKKLFFISIPAFLVLLIMGPWLFELVFGEAWRDAGVFGSILALYLLTQFISSPLVNALSVFDKQWLFLTINIVRLIGIIIIFGISYSFLLSPAQTILVYSLALSMHYIFTALIIFKVIKSGIAKHSATR